MIAGIVSNMLLLLLLMLLVVVLQLSQAQVYRVLRRQRVDAQSRPKVRTRTDGW